MEIRKEIAYKKTRVHRKPYTHSQQTENESLPISGNKRVNSVVLMIW